MLKEEIIDFDPRSGRMKSPPRQIFLELTECCNLACVICPVDYGSRSKDSMGNMPFSTIQRLLPWLRLAHAINLNIVGEPLLYPEFEDLLEFHDGPERNVHFNTNGVGLTREMCRKIVEGPVGSVIVSVDGMESNYPIRGVHYGKIRENVLRLVGMREQAGDELPLIGIAYTLMRRNLQELPRVLEDLLPQGIDRVHVQPLIIYYESLIPENIYETPGVDEVFSRCREITEKHGKELTLFRSTLKDDERYQMDSKGRVQLGAYSDRYGCIDPFYEIKILYNGSVLSCSNGRMGGLNVNDLSLEEVWNNDWYCGLRKDLYEGVFKGECERCPYIFGSADHQADPVEPGRKHSMEKRFFSL
jgi:MoaA/NifB/PqqE/SkfB family radical SAM enzyme